MTLMLFISMIMILISSIMMKMSLILSKKSLTDREKCSPFECGFDPKSSSRIPFSIRFFLIAIMFLIFDVEITLILPMILVLKYSNLIYWSITSMFFMTILLFGLYHEWNQGMLNWAK